MESRNQSGTTGQIDLMNVFRDILRQWWVILLGAAAVALLSVVVAHYRYQPKYTTTTTFVVTSKGLNSNIYTNLDTTKRLATRFSEVLNSTILKDRVTKELGLDHLEADTTATAIEETNMMVLNVTAGSAAESYRIMQSIMKNYDFISDYVVNDAILETIQAPVIAQNPDNPLNERYLLIRGFLIGLAAFAGLIGLVSYMRDTVKNESDFRRKIDARLLGSVFHEKKQKRLRLPFISKEEAKPSMLITNPVRSFRFVESNKMTASNVLSRMEKKGAKVLLMTSVMENEGKSTVAANVALTLAMEHKRVMLIDCDFRKPSLYKIFRIPESQIASLPDLNARSGDVDRLIHKIGDLPLYVIFNNEATSLEHLLESGLINTIVDFCRSRMDYIIIDSAPMALVSDTEELARTADASVLVVREDIVLSKDINDAIDIFNNTNGKILGCILNDVSESGLSGYAYGRSAYSGYGGSYGYGRSRNYSNYRGNDERTRQHGGYHGQ